ncbi:MAG: NAD-dependent epimerase/dehydratase family protein [Chitinophagales bacterium]|nr:NAD-dependent epimerase/dehydratase family protein [Chitinophagales bacterium]
MAAKLNILVTGGTGFLGRAIIHELLDEHVPLSIASVTILGLKERSAWIDDRIQYVQGDICNREEMNRACAGIDLVIHTAAIVDWGTKRPEEVYRVNFEGTRNVVEACRSNQVKWLLYTSSLDVVMTGKPLTNIDESQPYPARHLNMYCESKCKAEQLVLSANGEQLRTAVLRPADIWGEYDPYHLPPLIEMAKKGLYVRVGNGSALNQHIYVGNMAWAHVQIAKVLVDGQQAMAGQAYFITDGPGTNFFKFFDEIVIRSGYTIRPRNVWLPRWLMYAIGAITEFLALLLRPIIYYSPKLSRFAVLYITTDFTFSSAKAKRDFGFEPKYSKEEAIARTAVFFRKPGKTHQ